MGSGPRGGFGIRAGRQLDREGRTSHAAARFGCGQRGGGLERELRPCVAAWGIVAPVAVARGRDQLSRAMCIVVVARPPPYDDGPRVMRFAALPALEWSCRLLGAAVRVTAADAGTGPLVESHWATEERRPPPSYSLTHTRHARTTGTDGPGEEACTHYVLLLCQAERLRRRKEGGPALSSLRALCPSQGRRGQAVAAAAVAASGRCHPFD